jgi:hypothetical protein
MNHALAYSSGINSNRPGLLKIEPGNLINESYSHGIEFREIMTFEREE